MNGDVVAVAAFAELVLFGERAAAEPPPLEEAAATPTDDDGDTDDAEAPDKDVEGTCNRLLLLEPPPPPTPPPPSADAILDPSCQFLVLFVHWISS